MTHSIHAWFTCIYHILPLKTTNVGKYTSPMDGLGDTTNANLGSFLSVPKCFLIETTGCFSERERASGQQVSVF